MATTKVKSKSKSKSKVKSVVKPKNGLMTKRLLGAAGLGVLALGINKIRNSKLKETKNESINVSNTKKEEILTKELNKKLEEQETNIKNLQETIKTLNESQIKINENNNENFQLLSKVFANKLNLKLFFK